MPPQPTVYTVGDFVRRVVESLLRGECRGTFVCARCLVKLTRDNLDRSYAKPAIAQGLDEIFEAPGPISLAPASTCARCSRRKVPCLGMPPT